MSNAQASPPAAPTVEVLKDGFAALVSDIDLRAVANTDLEKDIRALHRDYPVLAFADQRLDAADFMAFARVFGEIEIDAHLTQFADAEVAGIIHLASHDLEGKPDPASADRGSAWHADSTYKADPCAHTLLYALEVPGDGGGTLFADMGRAWDRLPDDIKQRVEGRTARHLFGAGPATGGVIPLRDDQQGLLPAVEHPVVRTDPASGRKSLYVNPLHTVEIVGMARSESDALLARIFDHAVGEDFVYHHHWQVGQLVVWDQRRTIHRGEARYSLGERRHLLRTKIRGAG